MIRTTNPILAAACAAALALPALAEITYPVDVQATKGRWTIWDLQTSSVHAEHRTWPVANGGPLVAPDPRYAWLLEVRLDPPDYDSRLRKIAYPCPKAVDLVAATITETCSAVVRDPEELHTAVLNAAQERIDTALTQLGLLDPADQMRAIGLMQKARRGAVLTAEQEAWLDDLAANSIEYIDEVRARQKQIDAWIDANPGKVPVLNGGLWPRLPAER